jgi:hypothetical protein
MSGVDAEKAMLVIDSLEETPFLTIEAWSSFVAFSYFFLIELGSSLS